MPEEKASGLNQLRPNTKWPFVAFMTIVFTLSQLAARVLSDWLFGDPIRIRLSTVVISVIAGFLVSLIIWLLVIRRNQRPGADDSEKQ